MSEEFNNTQVFMHLIPDECGVLVQHGPYVLLHQYESARSRIRELENPTFPAIDKLKRDKATQADYDQLLSQYAVMLTWHKGNTESNQEAWKQTAEAIAQRDAARQDATDARNELAGQETQLYGRIQRLNAELERYKAALEWKPITTEGIPNWGDEALCPANETHGSMVLTVGFDSREGDAPRYIEAGYTHYRGINPPTALASEPAPGVKP